MSTIELPFYEYTEPAEAFVQGDVAQGCKPVDQPGVQWFARWLMARAPGGASIAIATCDRPTVSDHFEGRAWDWRTMADNPEDAARAQAVLDWLFADNWEVFRRLGLKYVIWNRHMYRAGGVVDYKGASPHTDHMHFSFGWPGAKGQTSWFRAAGFKGDEPAPTRPPTPGGGGGAPLPASPPPGGGSAAPKSSNSLVYMVAVAVGSAVGYFLAGWLMNS